MMSSRFSTGRSLMLRLPGLLGAIRSLSDPFWPCWLCITCSWWHLIHHPQLPGGNIMEHAVTTQPYPASPTLLSAPPAGHRSDRKGWSVTVTQMILGSISPSQLIILQQSDCCHPPLLYRADSRGNLWFNPDSLFYKVLTWYKQRGIILDITGI